MFVFQKTSNNDVTPQHSIVLIVYCGLTALFGNVHTMRMKERGMYDFWVHHTNLDIFVIPPEILYITKTEETYFELFVVKN